MGILDFLVGGKDAQLKRHIKTVRNLNAQHEERERSAQWLAEEGSDEAILGLLGRFTITYEHQMKDAQEKQLVLELLRRRGVAVTGPIKTWVKKAQNFAMPLTVVEELEGSAAVIEVLLEMLEKERDPFKPEKKRQILVRLAEHADTRIRDAVAPLLGDLDEGVRYAAVEVLANQPDAAAPLAARLADTSEESNRVRVRIADALRKRGWTLGAHAASVAAHPPMGWRVDGERLVPA